MAKQKPTIYDLVSDSIIKVGQTFSARDYMGTVVDNEHIKIEYWGEGSDPRSMGKRLYTSFSTPANQICGYSINAWFFWRYLKDKIIDRPIDDWRQEWLDEMSKIEVVYVCTVCGRETYVKKGAEPPDCKYCGGETEKVTTIIEE
jgi:hypothetical protein